MKVNDLLSLVENYESFIKSSHKKFSKKIEDVVARIELSHNKESFLNLLATRISSFPKMEDLSIQKFQKIINDSATEMAATRLQSILRMVQIKSKVILPGELFPTLMGHVKDLSMSSIICLSTIIGGLSREMFLNPSRFKNQGLRVSKRENVPISFWIQLNDRESEFRIQLYKKKIPGAEGTFKSFKASDTFVVSLTAKKEIKFEDTVLGRSKKPEDRVCIEKGCKLIRNLFSAEELKDPRLKIAVPTKTFRSYKGKTRPKLEWEEERYLGNFYSMRLDSFHNSLKIIDSIYYTLSKMHQKGFVHRDVKGKNILLKHDRPNLLEGYLSDFDTVTPLGLGSPAPYPYWDLCSVHGVILPSTDYFGLIITLGESFFGPLYPFIEKLRFDEKYPIHDKLDLSLNKFINRQADCLFFHLRKHMNPDHLEHEWKIIPNTEASIKKFIDGILKTTPEAKPLLNNYIAEIEAGFDINCILKDLINTDIELWNFIKSNPRAFVEWKELLDKFPLYKNLEAHLKRLLLSWETRASQ